MPNSKGVLHTGRGERGDAAAISEHSPANPAGGLAADPGANYRRIRGDSERLCAALQTEDYGIQTMPDVSPPKWHLAHVSWFFETFLLKPYLGGYREFHPRFGHLFNSYYETVGTFHPRPERGLLSRPTVAEVYRYRAHVDEHMHQLLECLDKGDLAPQDTEDVLLRTVIGLNHEQQHQELLLTDIKHIFAYNPLRPIYKEQPNFPHAVARPLEWVDYPGGVHAIGHAGEGFAYDNETPRHNVYLEDYRLASRPVTNGEFIEFIEAGGYAQAEHWLSEAWKTVRDNAWQAPLYWERIDGRWWYMTLGGMFPVDEHAPACHVSYYEADAYARWAGKRLPSEAEWELAAVDVPVAGNLRDSGLLHPTSSNRPGAPTQLYGDVWEWTQSPYAPYPGFRPLGGSLGEYNGKFMCSQMVLRGGSCVSPAEHLRATYRNFFYPGDRWQFSGFRLAEDK